MSIWFPVETRVRTHQKFVKAGPVASWVWVCGNCYAREHLTDGVLDADVLPLLVPGHTEKQIRKHAAALVLAGLWVVAGNGYEIHDFLKSNPSRQDIETQREKDRIRKKKGKDVPADSVGNPEGLRATPSILSSSVLSDPEEKRAEKPNVADLPPERPRTLIQRRDLGAFLQGPVFSIPQKWADRVITGSNGHLTERDLTAFGQELIDKVERERIDVTAQGNLLGWLDAQLKLWSAGRAARSSSPSSSRPASLRMIDEMEATRHGA